MQNYFDARIAERYDADSVEMFAPDTLDTTVAFLADLAGTGPALELASAPAELRSRSVAEESRSTVSTSRER